MGTGGDHGPSGRGADSSSTESLRNVFARRMYHADSAVL